MIYECQLWMLRGSESKKKETFRREYQLSKEKFNKIKKVIVGGSRINLDIILKNLKIIGLKQNGVSKRSTK